MPPTVPPPRANAPSPIRLLRAPATGSPARSAGLRAWVRAHKAAAILLSTLLVVAVMAAAVLAILQSITTSPAAKAPLVVFQTGSDYAAINTAGFATATIGTSGASATLSLSGVSGAASVTLGNVLKLNNQDATHPETVTLSRSAAPNAAITSFIVTVKDGASTLVTWNAASASSSSSFTLPVSTAADITIALVIADGTAAGALGSFSMDFTMTPT